MIVIRLKSCWVMNLDQGDEIGRHCDCGFEWGDPIGHGCDPGSELGPTALGGSALKRRYRTDAMLSHLRHKGPASVAVPHVRHRCHTDVYAAACGKAALARR